MTTRRTFARSAAVLGAATALTVAGAGAAMATTNTSNVDGNDVSVTFTLEDGDVADSCSAILTPTAAAAGLAAQLADGNVVDIIETLLNDDSVIVLKDGIGLPTAALTLLNKSNTVSATDVPSNVYALVSVCLSDTENPSINPFLLVGDPMEAIMGSIEMGSSGDTLGAASSLLTGEVGGDSGSDIGALLGGGMGDTGGAGETDLPVAE